MMARNGRLGIRSLINAEPQPHLGVHRSHEDGREYLLRNRELVHPFPIDHVGFTKSNRELVMLT